MVALLMATTGYRMSIGETREPIDVGEYIAHHAIDLYQEELTECNGALIADICLSTEDESARKEIINAFYDYGYNYDVTFVNDTVRITYSYHDRWSDELIVRTYRTYPTNGKPLSEGGEWNLSSYRYGDYVIVGDGKGGYTLVVESPSATCRLNLSNTMWSNEEGLTYDVEGMFDIAYNESDGEKRTYLTYNTAIAEPLRHCAKSNNYANEISFEGGIINIECNDMRDNRHDDVELTFASSERHAEVKYLDKVSSIKY